MTEIERTKLARERTHAAWLRTTLAFFITVIALRHYTVDETAFTLSLACGGVVAASQSASIAPDFYTKLISWSLIVLMACSPLLHLR